MLEGSCIHLCCLTFRKQFTIHVVTNNNVCFSVDEKNVPGGSTIAIYASFPHFPASNSVNMSLLETVGYSGFINWQKVKHRKTIFFRFPQKKKRAQTGFVSKLRAWYMFARPLGGPKKVRRKLWFFLRRSFILGWLLQKTMPHLLPKTCHSLFLENRRIKSRFQNRHECFYPAKKHQPLSLKKLSFPPTKPKLQRPKKGNTI